MDYMSIVATKHAGAMLMPSAPTKIPIGSRSLIAPRMDANIHGDANVNTTPIAMRDGKRSFFVSLIGLISEVAHAGAAAKSVAIIADVAKACVTACSVSFLPAGAVGL